MIDRAPIIVRVAKPGRFEIVLEVPVHIGGNAASIAKRMRWEGIKARRKGDEVIVEAT